MPVRPKNDPLAERLLKTRQKLGWSQKRMAQALLINRSTLSTWESFGPPVRGPARGFVLIMLKRLMDRKRALEAKKSLRANAAQLESAAD